MGRFIAELTQWLEGAGAHTTVHDRDHSKRRCEAATSIGGTNILAAELQTLPVLVVVVAHDSTLVPTLCALGAFDDHAQWPPYASQLAFEVYDNSAGRCFLRILWNGRPLELSNLSPSHSPCLFMYDVHDVIALLRPHGRKAQLDPSCRSQACAVSECT